MWIGIIKHNNFAVFCRNDEFQLDEGFPEYSVIHLTYLKVRVSVVWWRSKPTKFLTFQCQSLFVNNPTCGRVVVYCVLWLRVLRVLAKLLFYILIIQLLSVWRWIWYHHRYVFAHFDGEISQKRFWDFVLVSAWAVSGAWLTDYFFLDGNSVDFFANNIRPFDPRVHWRLGDWFDIVTCKYFCTLILKWAKKC